VQRELVRDLLLDEPLQRPGAEDGVVAVLGQPFLRRVRQLQRDLSALQELTKVSRLDVHDLDQVLPAQGPEHDHFVDAVQELRPQLVAQLFEYPRADRVLAAETGLDARPDDERWESIKAAIAALPDLFDGIEMDELDRPRTARGSSRDAPRSD
jgi:hypothetical protein